MHDEDERQVFAFKSQFAYQPGKTCRELLSFEMCDIGRLQKYQRSGHLLGGRCAVNNGTGYENEQQCPIKEFHDAAAAGRHGPILTPTTTRSEERRVGKECRSQSSR